MRVEQDGRYAAVASKRDFTARELSGEERERWWRRALDVWPDYADYQTKTERQIPVFVLEPAG
jgi:deazaflavin-dependent oxidoreductase (nitroreductase family)